MTSARTAGRSSPARRRVRSGVLYVLYLLGVLAAVLWFCHWRYLVIVRKHRAPEPAHSVPQIDAPTMRRLGWMHSPAERASAFARFPEQKRPGTVRIGCYGDSFTWGDEVSDGFDYPALLGQALRARGHDEFEVLNLGVSGYGMHQSTMLHETTAERWQLDRTVLLVRPYWPERDVTFMAPWADDRLHARYVLEHGEAHLLDVVGDAYEDRLETYLGLFPPLRYWRYDRRAPAVLQALLPAGRTLSNPWYYRADPPAQEALASYRLLLARMAARARPVLLLDDEGTLDALGSVPDTRRVEIEMPRGFPYRAGRRHLSPWGNRWLAAQVADVLVGPAPRRDPVLRVSPLADAPPGAPGTLAPSELGELGVMLDEQPVGSLVGVAVGVPAEAAVVDRLAPPADALVALAPDAGTPLSDALLIGVAAGTAGRVTATAGMCVGELGEPRAVGSTLALRRLDVCARDTLAELLGLPAGAPCAFEPTSDSWSRQATIAIDGRPVLVAGVMDERRIALAPVGDGYWIRARGDVAPALEGLPGAGRVWLRGRDAHGIVRREALASWTVEH